MNYRDCITIEYGHVLHFMKLYDELVPYLSL